MEKRNNTSSIISLHNSISVSLYNHSPDEVSLSSTEQALIRAAHSVPSRVASVLMSFSISV